MPFRLLFQSSSSSLELCLSLRRFNYLISILFQRFTAAPHSKHASKLMAYRCFDSQERQSCREQREQHKRHKVADYWKQPQILALVYLNIKQANNDGVD